MVSLVLTAVLSCSSRALCSLLRVSKMMAFFGLSESHHPPATSFRRSKGGWCVGKDRSFRVVILFGGPVLVETWLC